MLTTLSQGSFEIKSTSFSLSMRLNNLEELKIVSFFELSYCDQLFSEINLVAVLTAKCHAKMPFTS